jgi:hypothetical protein
VLNRLRRAELSVFPPHSLTVDSYAAATVASRILPRDDDAVEAEFFASVLAGGVP